MKLPEDRSHISTENRNPRSMNMHEWSISESVQKIIEEEKFVHQAIENAQEIIVKVIETTLPKFKAGGRLIYIGAGTSGRLGVLDASEIPPTYQLDHGRIIGLIAGGDNALRLSSEGKEDDYQGAIAELEKLNLNENDSILGIAAGGTTPYVLGALEYFKDKFQKGFTAFLCCADVEKKDFIDSQIVLATGPELVTGSTRMKAGTATKLVLNMISTSLMVQLGRVYENLMVDMKASNEKLIDRGIRMIVTLTDLTREDAYKLLISANHQVKPAIMMHFHQVAFDRAIEMIEKNEGKLILSNKGDN